MKKDHKIIYSGDHVLDIMSEHAVNRNNYIEELIKNSFHLETIKVKKKY